MIEPTLRIMLVVLVSYWLGSIPTAYLIARLHKINIFDHGSGNSGMTNMMRTMGVKWGLAVVIVDVLKGVVAILLSQQIMQDPALATTISAIAVVVGHNWSGVVAILTGQLKGGKGAATAFGTLLMIAPLHVIVAMWVVGGAVIALTRYMSLGVLTMVTIASLWLTLLVTREAVPTEYIFYVLFLAALIFYRFRGNISRLVTGTERRLGDSRRLQDGA